MGQSLKAALTSTLTMIARRPNIIAASIAVSTEMYFKENSLTGIPSFTLCPGGWERCMINLQLPGSIFGTTPSGLTCMLSNGGVAKGPAVWPASHSFAKYCDTILGCW